ncbi:SDR family NAD(P)-dependent oxidoreductase, partial [Sandarakinorhabdus sp.]|uniref:SDR family NAD(P)-dependent oxidoreductase n=1 Tax=Sandarakinorhabdus sp. TaxID=1916663 RepID=UPI00286DEECB
MAGKEHHAVGNVLGLPGETHRGASADGIHVHGIGARRGTRQGGSAGMSGDCATKGGVRLFTKAVAMECAMARDGIRCNSVHPGIIDTP